MKIADYSKVKALGQENVLLLDGPDGTKTILAPDLAKALIGLLSSEEFISGVNMADLEQATSVLGDNTLLLGTATGNQAVAATVLAKKLAAMLTSSELVSGLTLSELAKTTTLAAGDYVMAGLTAGNRAMTAKDLSKALVALLTSQEFISGLKMGDLTQATALTASDNILVGTSAGNKYMKASDATFAMLDAFAAPELHRMVFRGKNLGAALTAAQKTAIQNGTFKDLWLGDYWVINGVNWRIVDMDYWWNCGDAAFTKHHLVIMPDGNLGANKQMNATNTTEGGYVGSLMYTTNMADAKALCTGAFGSNILTHRDIFCNAVTNGRPTGYAWLDSSIELPTEVMIYGCPHYAVMNDGANIPMKYAISKSQLALFAVAPKFITTRQNYWLQDVVSAAYFAFVDSDGDANEGTASNSLIGVRPVFPVGVS